MPAGARPITSLRFWIQITRYQFEGGRSGFTFDAAIAEIKAKGYFLFTGSPELLGPTRGSDGAIQCLIMPSSFISSSVRAAISSLS
jgi:hypothetical protein